MHLPTTLIIHNPSIRPMALQPASGLGLTTRIGPWPYNPHRALALQPASGLGLTTRIGPWPYNPHRALASSFLIIHNTFPFYGVKK
jgi:hypothetical protein